MSDAVIGFSDVGAMCLSQIQRLSSVYPEQYRHTSAYFHISAYRHPALALLRFIPNHHKLSFCEAENSDIAAGSIRAKINAPQADADYLAEQDIRESRRFFAKQFRTNAENFWNALHTFGQIQDQESLSFHLIADIADESVSGSLAEVLRVLHEYYSAARLFLHLFYPLNIENDRTAAQIYATVLELQYTMPQNFCFVVHEYHSAESLNREQAGCASQIHTALDGVPVNPSHLPAAGSEAPQWHTLREIVLQTDSLSLHRSLPRQYARRFLAETLLVYDFNTPETPEWIDQLTTQKKWLLHNDFLTKEQDIETPDMPARYSSIEQEWSVRTQFFIDKSDSIQDWRAQVADIAASLDEVAQKLFRGCGIAFFYAMNENAVSRHARKIVENIESELVHTWAQDFCVLPHLLTWLNAVMQTVKRRMDACNNRYYLQSNLAEEYWENYQNLLSDWQHAKRSTRKAIQAEFPPEKVAAVLQNHYVASCHAKAMLYACRLLLTVITELDSLRNILMQGINEFQRIIAKENGEIVQISEHNSTQTDCAVRLQVSVDSGMLKKIPSLQNYDEEIYHLIQSKIIKEIRTERSFARFFDNLRQNPFQEMLVQDAVILHPFFQQLDFNNFEQVLFWSILPDYLSSSQQLLEQSVRSMNRTPLHSEESSDNHTAVILLPHCPLDREIHRRIVESCRNIAADIHVVSDAPMEHPQLIYRRAENFPATRLPGWQRIQEIYRRTIFGPAGAAYSFLLHTNRDDLPYPEYENRYLDSIAADDIRYALLLGEILGIVAELHTAEYEGIYLLAGNAYLYLGETVYGALGNITPARMRILNHALSNTPLPIHSETEVHYILRHRLNDIKNTCLSGMDIYQASWEDAANFVPWTRISKKVVARIRRMLRLAAPRAAAKPAADIVPSAENLQPATETEAVEENAENLQPATETETVEENTENLQPASENSSISENTENTGHNHSSQDSDS